MRFLLACLLLAAPAAGQEAAADAALDQRPNLLVVVTDDQRFDQLGCAGHPVLQTPHMDSLAARGVRFTNAFVTTPICAASRASLLTGLREGHHGYTFGTEPMGPELARDSYLGRLRAAGYTTSFVGKWGVRFVPGQRAEMLDAFRPLSPPYRKADLPHLTDRIAAEALDLLPRAPGGAPFCLTVSFNAPHAEDSHPEQFLPPADLAELYAGAPVPEHGEAGFEALPALLQESLGRRRWTWRFDTREKQVRRTRDYWRMIAGVDRALGRILAALEERELDANTVVVFLSDNGYFLGERGLAGKWLIYEESIRIPFLIYDPRRAGAARVVAAPALNVDLAPTLLDLAGVDQPAGLDGRSLVALLEGESPPWRQDFVVEHHFNHPEIPKSVGLRGERWVYTLFYGQEPALEQLFDLEHDPGQLDDLSESAEHAARLAEQRRLCLERMGPGPWRVD